MTPPFPARWSTPSPPAAPTRLRPTWAAWRRCWRTAASTAASASSRPPRSPRWAPTRPSAASTRRRATSSGTGSAGTPSPQPGLKAVGVTGWSKCGDSDDYSAEIVVAPKAKLAAIVTCVHPMYSTDCETLCERILLHALVDRGTLRHLPVKIPAVGAAGQDGDQGPARRDGGLLGRQRHGVARARPHRATRRRSPLSC